MDLRRILLFAAQRHPQRVAMVEGSDVLTYEQWVHRVLSVAGGLAENGVARGDRVAIGMRNSVDAATVFFATQVLGAVAVPFNFRFKTAGVGQVLADAEATAVIADADVVTDEAFAEPGVSRRMLKVVADSNPAPGWVTLTDLRTHGSINEGGHVDVDDLSTILYTSGTTGRPKGVPLTHGNTVARITSYISSAGPTISDGMRALGVAPIYHTVGLHWVLCQTVYLNGEYHPLADVNQSTMLNLIHDRELTYLFGSPTLFHIMLDGRAPKFDVLPSVRHTTFGSAPMPVPLFNEMVRCFENGTVNQVYGTTELSVPMVTNDCARHPVGALHCTADQRVRIVSPGGSPSDVVAEGESGELIVDVHTDANVSSYWNAPEKWSAKVRDGWFYTGDCFRRDAAGNYFVSGRLDDVIISGAENVQPAEVEQVLLEHPAIEDAAVVGTPDPAWGEVVTAFVVRVDPQLDQVAVDAHCRGSALADFKRPRRVLFVEAIPRNPSGKIIRPAVRALYTFPEAT